MTKDDHIRELTVMKDRLRDMRSQFCAVKTNKNPRYHDFSSAVSSIDRAIASLKEDWRNYEH